MRWRVRACPNNQCWRFAEIWVDVGVVRLQLAVHSGHFGDDVLNPFLFLTWIAHRVVGHGLHQFLQLHLRVESRIPLLGHYPPQIVERAFSVPVYLLDTTIGQ